MPKRLRSPSNLETNSNQNETPYPNDLQLTKNKWKETAEHQQYPP